jgi:hypothetical protein
MKILFNGFWPGFHDRTDPVNVEFFLSLMKEVYDTNVEVTFNINEADILIENTHIMNITDTLRTYKKWTHTYLFSGERFIRADKSEYDCVLDGSRNHKNIINVPLYLAYYVSTFGESYITENKKPTITQIPKNDVLVVVTNPGGTVRNAFMNELEKHFKVTYAGRYKNNIGQPLECCYSSSTFREFVGKFKFILTMENSEKDTYITEKITHGFLGGSIPIYWGSKRVSDYFNSDRFLEVKDTSDFDLVIQTMKNMTNEEWLKKVNLDPFTEFGKSYTIKIVANHIKNLLFSK